MPIEEGWDGTAGLDSSTVVGNSTDVIGDSTDDAYVLLSKLFGTATVSYPIVSDTLGITGSSSASIGQTKENVFNLTINTGITLTYAEVSSIEIGTQMSFTSPVWVHFTGLLSKYFTFSTNFIIARITTTARPITIAGTVSRGNNYIIMGRHTPTTSTELQYGSMETRVIRRR